MKDNDEKPMGVWFRAAMCRTNSATSGRGSISVMPMPRRTLEPEESLFQTYNGKVSKAGKGKRISPKGSAQACPLKPAEEEQLTFGDFGTERRRQDETDKRACRHAANAPLNISLNAGVLYTERVKCFVTAAVKLLGGHRALAVYFYECERLESK